MRRARYWRSSTAPANLVIPSKSRDLKLKKKTLSVVEDKDSNTTTTSAPLERRLSSQRYIGQAKAALTMMEACLPSHRSKWREWAKKLRMREAEVEAEMERLLLN